MFQDSYVLCVYDTKIMNVLRTGMNMSISTYPYLAMVNNWTQVSRAIGKYSNHYSNVR